MYGIEELLDRIYSLLTAYGYEVWMSHKGTLPVVSDRTAFENCLAAVEKCDLFLGLITPQYGSGREGLTLKKSQILDDLRVLDLYEEAIGNEKDLPDRVGNWVQKFRTTDDGSLFVVAQFYRYQEVEDFIRENFAGGSPVHSEGGEA